MTCRLFTGLALALLLAAGSASADTTLKPHHQALRDCALCHKAENALAGNAFVVPSDEACLGCHGSYAALARKTAALDEPNPHASAHYGEGLSCTACHREHRASRVYCTECHEFKYDIK